MRCLGSALALVGIFFAAWALQALGPARFLGRPSEPPQFIVRGPYRLLRHPFYLGVLLILLGIRLATDALIVSTIFAIDVAVTILLVTIEERRLLARLGDAYRRYREAVPALIPLPARR